MTHPLRLVIAFCLGMAALSAFMGAARAAPVLRPHIIVTQDIVMLGDLVSDAGAAANQPVFRAPGPGLTGQVSAKDILSAATRIGVNNISTGGITQVSVARTGRAAGKAEIEAALRLRLADQSRSPAPENIDITFDHAPLVTANGPADAALSIGTVSWTARTGRFEAEVLIGDPARPLARQSVTGTAIDGIDVVVAARAINRSAKLGKDDLAVVKLPRTSIPADALTSLDQAIGMAARRSLRSDEPLKPGDLDKPVLVERGGAVTIVHAVPGMTLTVRGQALASGARGASVSVLNIQSKRTIEGTVTGPGQVTVTSGHAIMLSAR